MSYSTLLSMAAAGNSSSLDAITSQFAHLPPRRKDASAAAPTTASSPTSTSLVRTAVLSTSSGDRNDPLLARLQSRTSPQSLTKNSTSRYYSDRSCGSKSIRVSTSSSSSPSSSSSSPADDDNKSIFSASSASTPSNSLSTGSPAPVASIFAPADALTILGPGSLETGSGAGKKLFPALTKFDQEANRSGDAVAHSEDRYGSLAAAGLATTRVETVEWHMLDKRKFYPMSTTCSFMIRGMLFPFTLIKTRIQIQEQTEMYKGTWDALRKIYASEGVSGFYRGFWVNSIQVFSGIFYISTYEGVRHLMATQLDVHDLVLRAFVGGLCASVVGQMITVPFDVVSQHMMLIGGDQSKGPKRLRITRHDAIHVPPEALKTRFGAFQTIIREIHNRHGIPGYYKGYWISICTYAPNSALWWGFYHWYIDVLSQVLPSAVPALMVQSCSAPAAGLSAAVITNPIDVVRARVQVEGTCTAREAAMRLWQEERYKMFTKGLSARFIQSSFFSFLIILGYETVKRLSLKEEFKNSVPW